MLTRSATVSLTCMNTDCHYHLGWCGCGVQSVTVGASRECLSYKEKEEYED